MHKKWSEAYKGPFKQTTILARNLLSKRRRLGKVKGNFARTGGGKSSGVCLTRDTRWRGGLYHLEGHLHPWRGPV